MGRRVKKIKKPNKTDLIIKNNFYLLYTTLKELQAINFLVNPVVCHGDLISSNVLFNEKGKLVALLDFDNLKIAPRMEDLSYTLRVNGSDKKGISKKRQRIILKEFEKAKIKLSKKEKDMIIPLMIRGNLIVLWWMYSEMKKGQNKKYVMIKYTIDTILPLIKKWKVRK